MKLPRLRCLLAVELAIVMFIGSEGMSASARQNRSGNSQADQPAWIGTREGISDAVLPPWTPLVVDRRGRVLRVRCWGRTYEFGKRPFARAIVTGGAPVLRAPIRVIARADGRAQVWRGSDPRLIEARPDRVRLSQEAKAPELTLSAETAIEYDGMALTHWRLEPRRALRLEGLTVEIPLPAECAKLLWYYPHYERSWSEHRPGELKPEGFVDRFRPVMWLGDEERGLEWFAESDENWFSDQPERVIEVKRDGDAVVLRLKIVTTPVELAPDGPRSSLSYTFGLQATPIRPNEKDAWDYRIFHVSQPTFGVQTRLDIPDSELDALVAAGVRTIAFHEHWTDIESYTTTTYGEQLRRLVGACHQRGLKLLLYFGFLISDLAPEWAQFGDQCVMQPRGGYEPYNYPPQPRQNAYKVCYRSVWQDFLAHGIARVMDQYDVDGVYLDGTADPFDGCINRRHGCGYVRPDGSIGKTYAILAIRSMMRRIYTIVKSRKPDGQVNLHQSSFMVIPTMAWATSYWDGEQLAGRPPLDHFRTELIGRQWGLPAEFLAMFDFRQACGLALLHDVPTRAVHPGADLELTSGLWRVFDDFGRKDAQWLPYWRNAKYVSVEPQDFCASLYRHPHNGALMAVLNNGAQERTGSVKLHVDALGLRGALSARDALSGEHVAAENGVVQLTLPSYGWRLLWFQARRSG